MTDTKIERRAEIETAAFEVLAKVGFKKASMLQIAKHAKASNETLYSWYGNKQALFSSLIETNSQAVRDALETALHDEVNPKNPLAKSGELLLQFTATDRAITVNRAAIADVQETGLLADAIEEHARRVIYQHLESLMQKLEATGQYNFDQGVKTAARVFISLLLGEVQLQQALGTLPPLSQVEIEQRASEANQLFERLYRKNA